MNDMQHPDIIYIGEDTLHINYKHSFQTDDNVKYIRHDIARRDTLKEVAGSVRKARNKWIGYTSEFSGGVILALSDVIIELEHMAGECI